MKLMKKYGFLFFLIFPLFLINILGCGQQAGKGLFVRTVIDSSSDIGVFCQPKIFLDFSGNPLIIYLQGIGTNESIIKLATYRSGAWEITRLYSSIIGSDYRSHGLAADIESSGNLHILFGNGYANSSLNHFYQSGGSWIMETIASDVLSNNFDIQIDSSNLVHVIYKDSSAGSFIYAFKQATGNWIKDYIPTQWNSQSGVGVTLRLDNNEQPQITYAVSSIYPKSLELYIVRFNGIAWEGEKVSTLNKEWVSWCFDLDSHDIPHLAYYDDYLPSDPLEGYNYYKILHSFYDGAFWQTEELDRSVCISAPIDINFDSLGQPHLIYNATDPEHRAKYVLKKPTGSWEEKQISENILIEASFCLDKNNIPHIVTSSSPIPPDTLLYYFLK
jgi:hypothetical protein